MPTIAPEREDTRLVPDAGTPAPLLDDGDHERFSHYITKQHQEASILAGEPAIALCGKIWVPGRDPKKFPICPDCQALFDMGPKGRAEFFAKRAEESGD